MDPSASTTIEVAALGRPFNLGMLYDCRQDSLIPGRDSYILMLHGNEPQQKPH